MWSGAVQGEKGEAGVVVGADGAPLHMGGLAGPKVGLWYLALAFSVNLYLGP